MTNKTELDDKIFKLAINCDQYNKCGSLFVYVSSVGEVGTRQLIAHALKDGKKVCVPKCNTDECTMTFYQINSMDELSLGAYGILEPDTQKCSRAAADKNSLCIVPGLSFDKRGYRLGFGKGYYDRFLSDFIGEAVGLCYECCLSEKLIINEFDQKVSALITENKIYKF